MSAQINAPFSANTGRYSAPVRHEVFVAKPGKTALICMDFQKTYERQWRYCWAALTQNIRTALNEATTRNMLVIHVAHVTGRGREKRWHSGIAPLKNLHPDQRALLDERQNAFELSLADEDLVTFKPGYSAAQDTSLPQTLKTLGIETILIVGLCERRPATESDDCFCVSVSARDFRNHGFSVGILANATNGMTEPLTTRRKIHDPWGVHILEPGDLSIPPLYEGEKRRGRPAPSSKVCAVGLPLGA